MCGCMLLHAAMGHQGHQHDAPAGTTVDASHQARCIHCGFGLQEGFAFCPGCGMSLQTATCPACGQKVETGWRACAFCGSPLGKSAE